MLLFWSIIAACKTFLCFVSAVPMHCSTFLFVGSVWLKEEISFVIDVVPFSLYVLQLMRNVYFCVFCGEICIK